GHTLIEGMIHSPARAGSVENKDLRALRPLRSRSVLPIAVAGVELAGMRGEDANFSAAHKSTRAIQRPRRKRNLELALRIRRSGHGTGCRKDENTADNPSQYPNLEVGHCWSAGGSAGQLHRDIWCGETDFGRAESVDQAAQRLTLQIGRADRR